MLRRNWDLARAAKAGLPCRVCGKRWRVELGHILPRRFDLRTNHGRAFVDPDSVVPLCVEHHQAYDAHRFDLWPLLTESERSWAVERVGYGEARRRISGRYWLRTEGLDESGRAGVVGRGARAG